MIVLSYSSYKNGIISNFWWFPILKWPQEFRSKLTISYFWYFWAFDHIPKFLFFAIFRIFHIFCEIGQKMMRSFEDRMRFYSELIGIFDRIRISWISGRRFAIGKILSFLAIIYPAYQTGHFYHWNQFHPRQKP